MLKILANKIMNILKWTRKYNWNKKGLPKSKTDKIAFSLKSGLISCKKEFISGKFLSPKEIKQISNFFSFKISSSDNLVISALINKIFSGKRIEDIKNPESLIDSELTEFKELFESIIAIIASYSDKDDKGVYLEGQSKFLESPDQDLASAKGFLEIIGTKEKLVDVVDSGTDIEFNVKIGKDETGGLDKCAIVTAKYKYKGKDIGYAGVIGPERMNYGKVMGVLDYIKKTIDGLDGGSDE